MVLKKQLTDYIYPQDLKEMTDDELDLLAASIRDFLITKVSKTGGHLAPNLGVVELTLALHRVFDVPDDKIVWDVGHQTYVHKILTGRAEGFDTLRQYGGMSGFPKPQESAADVCMSGHSSTSISAAMGIAEARDIAGDDFSVVAVIGDGAMTGGPAYEGLNNAGTKQTSMIVVLNDNNMSIAENVGSLSQHLTKLRASKRYRDMKRAVREGVSGVPLIGEGIVRGLENLQGLMRYALVTESIFEDLGFSYYGPVDGHNIKELTDIFNSVRDEPGGPVLIHVVTKKGKGYKNAELAPDKFHGIGPFDTETGKLLSAPGGESWSGFAGRELLNLAHTDKRVVAITAAMTDGTGLKAFADTYPQRFYDAGIAEQHAVTFAAGLAIGGLRPFVCVYSTFMQRAYDQIMCDAALQKLPVVFLIDRAGHVGADGETHHGVFDLSYLGHIPNMTVLTPADGAELEAMLKYALKRDDGPVAIRYPRGSMPQDYAPAGAADFTEGKSRIVFDGNAAADDADTVPEAEIWAAGVICSSAVAAAQQLAEEGHIVRVVSAMSVKPLDTTALRDAGRRGVPVVTLEDNVISGGFGEAVTAFLASEGYGNPVANIAWPDEFLSHGDTAIFLHEYGLDAEGVRRKAGELIRGTD
ncbi:MAG: 1-deoxy-D-xylulose-5-phosphate synthase [Clostridiales Family XIII bacterium]|jgi:1-deoxy-D-xylulose-5-phosphate synthase|nr:1-deoxy-D-xylulose-5-phosphate synthase [Clostridiales Family XIII bacterium]